MADPKKPNKLNIESGEQGSLTLKGSDGQIETTRETLIDDLATFHDSDDIIKVIQEEKLAKKREQYEALKPTGFEYAPKSAKKKWERYKNADNLEKLQWIHDNVSYNADHTMNIIKLETTFCEDVSGTGKRCNWEDAKQLAESKGYTLGSDYNDSDSQEIRESSDWYKVINVFSNGNGDTVEGMEVFRDMAGCNDRYWTSTEYKDNNSLEGFARHRILYENYCTRRWSITGNIFRVCGFKDSI